MPKLFSISVEVVYDDQGNKIALSTNVKSP
jgi:hypothetical protein